MFAAGILERKGRFVATIGPDDTVLDAVQRLREHECGALVVSPDGREIAGIVSERDIVRQLATEGPSALEAVVSTIMKSPVQTCRSGDKVDSIMQRMTEHRFRHLPVVDDDGRLAGIVSIGDAVKARVDELETEREQLVDYVRGDR